MSRFIFATLLALSIAPSAAHAVAHNDKVTVEKLRDPNTKQVIGARIHGIADPENYSRFRVNIGKLQLPAKPANDTEHREMAAGIKPGYVRAQIHEAQNLTVKPSQPGWHELQEFHVDVIYGQNNDLKPGDKVDIYTTYNNPVSNPTYWHVFGMHDGPVNKGDVTHVHEMPSDTSAHPEATQFGE